MKKNNSGIYINSLEATAIHRHMTGGYIKYNYIGMIPYSLELKKLISVGLEVANIKKLNKQITDDIINVKFTYNAEDIKANELRQQYYTNGFTITNPTTGEIIKYVLFKRTSAKSRVGQVLFIREELAAVMSNWSLMGLDIPEGSKIDLPSLLAYQALISSSITGEIVINPENILLISDVESVFQIDANVIRTGENGYLDSFAEVATIKNCLFDGESLLDSNYFPADKGMILLRNHFTKTCSFSINMQLWFADNNVNTLTDMFGNVMDAKDVHMIMTPSSLKAFKFSHLVGSEEELYNYWKEVIRKDDCVWGICKSEKKSKRGYNEAGDIQQQTSYQFINSIPFTQPEIQDILTGEVDYIKQLQNDDNKFMEYLGAGSDKFNTNQMWIDLYQTNNKIANTAQFRSFRANQISDEKKHIKKGKIKLSGDYCVLLSAPIEMLMHSAGMLPVNDGVLDNDYIGQLTANQIITPLHSTGEYVAWRNPHTSPSNVLLVENVVNADIGKYVNLTDNIVVINVIKYPILDILSGADFDSDTMCIVDNKTLTSRVKQFFGQYKVCVNAVKADKATYHYTLEDMYKVDNVLSNSQKYIGNCVNTGQIIMSEYWNELSKGVDNVELMQKVDIATILSGIAIDSAKKLYSINISKEINNIKKSLSGNKPLFWASITDIKVAKTTKYECPMDYLAETINGIERAKCKNPVLFHSLMVKKTRRVNNDQLNKVYEIITEADNAITTLWKKYNCNPNKNESLEKELYEKVNNIQSEVKYELRNTKIKTDTMVALLKSVVKNGSIRQLKMLHETQKDIFLEAFM